MTDTKKIRTVRDDELQDVFGGGKYNNQLVMQWWCPVCKKIYTYEQALAVGGQCPICNIRIEHYH